MLDSLKNFLIKRKLYSELVIAYLVFVGCICICLLSNSCELANIAFIFVLSAMIAFLVFFVTILIRTVKCILSGVSNNRSISTINILIKFVLSVLVYYLCWKLILFILPIFFTIEVTKNVLAIFIILAILFVPISAIFYYSILLIAKIIKCVFLNKKHKSI